MRPINGTPATFYTGESVTALAASDTRGQTKPAQGSDGYGNSNFENTPVTTVAKVVLGDILGVGYTIDPRVQGSLTSPLAGRSRDQTFCSCWKMRYAVSNIVLVRDTAGYRIVPLGDAIGSAMSTMIRPGRSPATEFRVVPLHYVSVQTLIKLLDSFATKPGTVRADATRNMLLIQGSGAERRADRNSPEL